MNSWPKGQKISTYRCIVAVSRRRQVHAPRTECRAGIRRGTAAAGLGGCVRDDGMSRAPRVCGCHISATSTEALAGSTGRLDISQVHHLIRHRPRPKRTAARTPLDPLSLRSFCSTGDRNELVRSIFQPRKNKDKGVHSLRVQPRLRRHSEVRHEHRQPEQEAAPAPVLFSQLTLLFAHQPPRRGKEFVRDAPNASNHKAQSRT